jgi:hypothetical protein
MSSIPHAYGYLAAITFLSRLTKFYNAYSTPRMTIKMFSDSKGWQAQKKWFFDRIVDRPREYSYPDHDVPSRSKSSHTASSLRSNSRTY